MANLQRANLEEQDAVLTASSATVLAGTSTAAPVGFEFKRNQMWRYFGPAFVASVAYIDPGNFATNIEGGSRFGYRLLWVLLWSNAMAILIQYLSAKLGIVTGLTLPQNCRKHFSRPVTIGLWVAAEVSAIATDLAEFLGAALGCYLLFGPALLAHGWTRTGTLLTASLLSAVAVFVILALDLAGYQWLERVIMAWLKEVKSAPRIPGGSRRSQFLRFELVDVLVAMNGAWLINSAMIVMAAVAFAHNGTVVADVEQAYRTLGPLLGPAAATVFAVALLCSGLSSSTVGVMAGQVIIEGFLNIKFPIFLRRLITIIPAIIIIAIGLDPLKILILSQVVLSFSLPFALIPLLMLTSRRSVMDTFASARRTRIAGWTSVAVILTLNAILVSQLAFGR
jgi:manganese transport protein